MKHGAQAGAHNRWVEAGMPTIPRPSVTATRSIRRIISPRHQAAMAAYAPQPAREEAQKGWGQRIAGAVGRFLQRRRA